MDSFRSSLLEKKYMKFFTIAMIFLVIGITLIVVGRLFYLYSDPSTPEEMEFSLNFRYTLSYLSIFLLQLGLIMFCFSAFWGAVIDSTLSETVRRGMVFTASISIVALALIMIFGGMIII